MPIGLDDNGATIFTPGKVVYGPDGSGYETARFGLPLSLAGKRVLDIGGWDGQFSFEAIRRGAKSVTMIDIRQDAPGGDSGMEFALEIFKPSNFTFLKESVLDHSPAVPYDVVLFYGVLYHLKHPTVALENIHKITAPGGLVITETAGEAHDPRVAFDCIPGCANDPTNTWYPTFAGFKACCEGMFGFENVSLVADIGNRYTASMARKV